MLIQKYRNFVDRPRVQLFLLGSRIGVRGAIVGSIVFAMIDFAISMNNLEFHLVGFLYGALNYTVVIFFLAAIFFLPASILGGLFALNLHKVNKDREYGDKIVVFKGLLIGALAGFLVCLPIFIDYKIILYGGYGDFSVQVFRIIRATIIASIVGGWSAKQVVNKVVAIE